MLCTLLENGVLIGSRLQIVGNHTGGGGDFNISGYRCKVETSTMSLGAFSESEEKKIVGAFAIG